MTASITASGVRRSLTVTFTPSSFSSSRRPTIIGRFTTRVTVLSRVSSSAAGATRGAAANTDSVIRAMSASTSVLLWMVMSAPCGGERLRGGARRVHDVLVSGAAAQIAGERLTDLLVRGMGALAQEARERHEKARRAEAALQAVMLAKRLLQRIQRVAIGEPFHRLDVAAVHLRGKEQTRANRRAIQDDRAGAAHAVLAAQMRPGQLEIVAQEVGERLAHFHRALVRAPVDG